VLRWPMIVFMCCLAHQVNLLMNYLLTKVMLFKTNIDQSFKATSFLLKPSATLMPRLHDKMSKTYTKTAGILKACWTRWNLSQMCLASLLRVGQACDALYVK
jgi:hypothetical protein